MNKFNTYLEIIFWHFVEDVSLLNTLQKPWFIFLHWFPESINKAFMIQDKT